MLHHQVQPVKKFLTRADIRKIFPEIKSNPKKYKWIENFICDDQFMYEGKPYDVDTQIGAKGKGGSWKCNIRMIFQCLLGKNGVIIRREYRSHFKSVNEIKTRIIPLIERLTGKPISRWMEFPSDRVRDYNNQVISFPFTKKGNTISFYAYTDPDGTSNVSGIHECFFEEFLKINTTKSYVTDEQQLSNYTFEKILDNFNRFDPETEKGVKTNYYFSMNPHDLRHWLIKKIYAELFDFEEHPELFDKLKKEFILNGIIESFLGQRWLIRHCSVFSNPHQTASKKLKIKKTLADESNVEQAMFMIWGLPFDESEVGWLLKNSTKSIELTDTDKIKTKRWRIGFDCGKVDNNCWVVCCDNVAKGKEIIILNTFSIKNKTMSNTMKVGYLLKQYLKWLEPYPEWFKQHAYKLHIYIGADSHWIKDSCDLLLAETGIPVTFVFHAIGKTQSGMLITQRHTTLKQKMIRKEVKYMRGCNIKPLLEEFNGTIYDKKKIFDKYGNDFKDAFFYANYRHFAWDTSSKVDINPPNELKHKNKLKIDHE